MITLTPAKLEVSVAPGQDFLATITLANKSEEDLLGRVLIEDFGPPAYSLNRFLIPAVREFALAAGETRQLPLTIKIPADQGPGGLYSSVVIGFRQAGESANSTESRLASLLFVKVPGQTQEVGELIDFGQLAGQGKLGQFYLTFQNTGNVYLNPYGVITIKQQGFFSLRRDTRKEFTVPIDPWYVLPGDTRTREIGLTYPPQSMSYGHYRAEVSLNRGYQDIIDTRAITFWVLPPTWVLILVGLLFLGFLFGFGRKLLRHGKI
ncbi:MAG: hypothetical protein AAB589_02180 [Patescibacteria group bacterium]